ncbi:hypothetical protein G6O67_004613 [Ophiocordyceps sinensis]|uniref:chitinase n=1 Tax=Ophiocordyceps sinensis TaxID=72228 RepID=A0A8H4V4S0_9HYPO|nr:hypothetical protein G6O67_004613 [Ophiocordyceps sinensis]
MWPGFITCVLWGASLVSSAINLDGDQVLLPLAEDDASPIGDPGTYHPDRHDCPLRCADYTNMHSWITYFSVDRLSRCEKPMLLQLSVTQPLDDPDSTILIRSCTLESVLDDNVTETRPPVDNPKKANDIFWPSLDEAPACLATGLEVDNEMSLAMSSGSGHADGQDLTRLIQGMQDFFDAPDNCDESFVFAYHKGTVASIFVGKRLGKRTVSSALGALAGHLGSYGPIPDRVVAQLCHGVNGPEHMLGVSIDTTFNLAAVQKTAFEWSMGSCAGDQGLHAIGVLPNIKTWEISANKTWEISANKTWEISANKTWEISANKTLWGNQTLAMASFGGVRDRRSLLIKRKTCSHVKVIPGDSCASLASRCDISRMRLRKYNRRPHFCSTLMPDEYICCSTGDPYTEPRPEPSADGTCAIHVIENGDSCFALAQKYGVSVDKLEEWNKGKVWAWNECKEMLAGYNMCVSDGSAPLPPSQEGTECGPLVPGTDKLLERARRAGSFSLADLNPCPLKACCSNWGYCGVFPAHCDVNAPEGGGPGSKKKGHQNTCVSNCGMEMKQNSGPPQSFQRIGYYESWNLQRDCLWLKAKNANTDGSYTHIHWGFADIEPGSWKPVIKDPGGQWNDFKALANVKRVVSFGGWAYSTEPASYGIIRSAIIYHREEFATNLAEFAQNEGIDGIDIDWEYPGAPDILVNGQPIGQKRDGINYLRFLTVLRDKLGSDKSLSIAAPASYWYLKGFPIDKIAEVIDYIVYMTYDLHGQWDYGNVNAFDSCPSGKCIRSHVTKAGVPNDKIFVGESSYGRSFRMAKDDCWRPDCEFTGSRTQSDANPGRCTKTAGYISNAEISEMLKRGAGARSFYDGKSDTDVVLFQGDYIGYMSPTIKDARRAEWSKLNFAGTIDWALDLQEFTADDYDAPPPDRPKSGLGCIQGDERTVNTGDLCAFSCSHGFCPESLCQCLETGPIQDLPPEESGVKMNAFDAFDVDLNRLCSFACKYGHCPDEICKPEVGDSDSDDSDSDDSDGSSKGHRLPIHKKNPYRIDYAAVRRENANLCHVFKDTRYADMGRAPYMLATAAQMASYLYPDEEDPEGAFSWWLTPCGGTDLVPDDVKKVFDDLNQVPHGRTSFKKPKKIGKGSGKKGDGGNPRAPVRPKPTGGGGGRPGGAARRCHVPAHRSTKRMGVARNTLRLLSCDRQSRTRTVEMVITSLVYAPNAKPTLVTKTCSKRWSQACYHYSSAIRENKQWSTLTCPQEAATIDHRRKAQATVVWEREHMGQGWRNAAHRAQSMCHMDEWPPVYLLGDHDPARINAGQNQLGQRVRFLPASDNTGAAHMWKSVCFSPALDGLSNTEIKRQVERARKPFKTSNKKGDQQTHAMATVTSRPQFAVGSWGHSSSPARDDGLRDNSCWPSGIAANDPGFALLSLDEWYDKNPRAPGQRTKWDYSSDYKKGQNGD